MSSAAPMDISAPLAATNPTINSLKHHEQSSLKDSKMNLSSASLSDSVTSLDDTDAPIDDTRIQGYDPLCMLLPECALSTPSTPTLLPTPSTTPTLLCCSTPPPILPHSTFQLMDDDGIPCAAAGGMDDMDCVDDMDDAESGVEHVMFEVPPQIIQMEYPLTIQGKATVAKARKQAKRILNGEDDRILVIVGPCSIHDVNAALDYGNRLKALAEKHADSLVIIMRSYFEKPRTTVGWKGLINDPHIDGSFKINEGLRIARKLLCDLTSMGVPVGCELLDTISPQFIADTVSWGAIGARTTECQLHRELASGVSFPVGFKNGTDGSVTIALDAIVSASHPHHFLGVTKQGLAAITKTQGNDLCHIILRGSNKGPNYAAPFISAVKSELVKANLKPKIMVDCSHGNSSKKHKNQITVCADVASQIASGDESIFGLMIESNIKEGNQKVPKDTGKAGLEYGVSITDACVSWEDTVAMLDGLAEAQKKRRALLSQA
ncbi:3-deoxy-7-phosphoheptulonate synthase [Chytridiales sp. JEL 0842]|nr:3-deoxy-7-phosphoheptulonate synthase [Chytridiales sp. JEL 0842]